MAFPPAKEPATLLGRHRQLSPTAAVRVSPLCLGAMNFGEAWKGMMGECTKENAFDMMDCFYQSGGNFIDTANNYQGEESEQWIGEWMAKRGNRDEMVIATKYTTNFMAGKGGEHSLHSNFSGNSSKSLHVSVEGSLKKLQTSYIDLLWVHWWDMHTDVPELMQSLNRMVQSGKVLYLGISDTPAWMVTKCNQYARDHGMPQFVVYQGQWSAAKRDMENEIVPMCMAEGMGICPWGAMGGGNFKPKAKRNDKGGETGGRNIAGFGATEIDLKVADVLEKIANQRKLQSLTSVALAYVMNACPDVHPLVGGRSVSHLKANIEALSIQLTDDELKEIEDASGFNYIFPMSFFLGGQPTPYRKVTPMDNWLNTMSGHYDFPRKRLPAQPPQAK